MACVQILDLFWLCADYVRGYVRVMCVAISGMFAGHVRWFGQQVGSARVACVQIMDLFWLCADHVCGYVRFMCGPVR